jgi:hypothetical protein
MARSNPPKVWRRKAVRVLVVETALHGAFWLTPLLASIVIAWHGYIADNVDVVLAFGLLAALCFVPPLVGLARWLADTGVIKTIRSHADLMQVQKKNTLLSAEMAKLDAELGARDALSASSLTMPHRGPALTSDEKREDEIELWLRQEAKEARHLLTDADLGLAVIAWDGNTFNLPCDADSPAWVHLAKDIHRVINQRPNVQACVRNLGHTRAVILDLDTPAARWIGVFPSRALATHERDFFSTMALVIGDAFKTSLPEREPSFGVRRIVERDLTPE